MNSRHLAACVVATVVLAGPNARAQHGAHPPMPDQQYYLQCGIKVSGESVVVEEPVKLLSPASGTELTQEVQPPGGLPAVRLLHYLPQAALQQRVVEDSGPLARPAVQLRIIGPSQTHTRWLVADQSARNRLTSFIATWRFMAVANREERNALLEQFKTEFTRDPVLVVRPAGGGAAREVTALAGTKHTLKELGCTIRIKEFFPHFAIDDRTNKPLNRSEQRKNPAALVEVTNGDSTSERWIFAKFPDYGVEGQNEQPVSITLDCAVQTSGTTPDYVLVAIARKNQEVWTRFESAVSERTLAPDDVVPIAGSQYSFDVQRFMPSGRLVEEYTPAEGRTGAPALKIETIGAGGKRDALWLTIGKPRIIQTARGPMTLSFGPRRGAPAGGHK